MEDPKLKKIIKPDKIDVARSKMFIVERHNLLKKLKKISIESDFKNLILDSRFSVFMQIQTVLFYLVLKNLIK